MTAIYLWFNAVLYAVFALWCTLRHVETARAVGFALPGPSGHSEYLVVYGGLQMGLAMFYAWLAYQPALHRTGIVFSLMLYAPIVAYRLATLFLHGPVGTLTKAVAALEVALLAAALLLYLRTR